MTKKLLQIYAVKQLVEDIHDLKKELGLSSLGDVVNHAVMLFKWVFEMHKNGYQIYALPEDGEGEKEKLVFLLPR